MRKYEIFYNQQKRIIEAESLYAAKLKAIGLFQVPKAKRGLIAVQLQDSKDFMFN